ncbi:MAG: hypothetical protein IPM18_09670 [Phycisphaerales bacterium]|nr:hypothetical protein [Phycisphaerales bacterium]
MLALWHRKQRWLIAACSSGTTLGILQGFELVDFASLFTSFLASLLSLIVSLLLGGALQPLQSSGGFF